LNPIWKLSRLFVNLQDYPETSQTVRTLSRQSGNFPDYPETFQTIQKLSRLSGNFQDHPKLPSAISRVTRRTFPDAKKLSGWQCHDATVVFVPLSS